MSRMKCYILTRQFHCTSHHAGAKRKARVALTLLCALFEHECAPDAHRIYFPPNLLSTYGIYMWLYTITLFARFGERQVECEVDCVWGRAHLKVNEGEAEYVRNWGSPSTHWCTEAQWTPWALETWLGSLRSRLPLAQNVGFLILKSSVPKKDGVVHSH